MFTISYPSVSGNQASISLPLGSTLFVVGANGTGKSSLMHKFYVQNYEKARQISAHRQTWFSSSAITLSPQQKRDTETNIKNTDTSTEARWKDQYSANRASLAIYDLIDAENVRARLITGAVERDALNEARVLAQKDAPLRMINELLQQSNIPVTISVRESEQVLASKHGGPTYSVAELSDGERNALLIAANILTAKPGTLILVDEPERHLHRSIISPLLTLLFAKRSDCSFIVSTHDVMLPIDNPTARTLLVRSCNYQGSTVTAWDADMVEPTDEIDEALKLDVLGSRRKLVFVEGDEQSLDKPLYSLIFPLVSIIPKSSCHEVERSVGGIRDANRFHWVSAWGIVDNDRRTTEEIDELKAKGVFALPVFAVESIYYDPKLQRMVAEKHASLVGSDVEECLRQANQAAINAIKPHINRLCERAVEKALRDEVFKHLPRRRQISAGQPIKVEIDVAQFVARERQRFESLIDNRDLAAIIAAYPVRETPALDQIVDKLGFKGRLQYESAVRRLLMENGEALNLVRAMFGDLISEINQGLAPVEQESVAQ